MAEQGSNPEEFHLEDAETPHSVSIKESMEDRFTITWYCMALNPDHACDLAEDAYPGHFILHAFPEPGMTPDEVKELSKSKTEAA